MFANLVSVWDCYCWGTDSLLFYSALLLLEIFKLNSFDLKSVRLVFNLFDSENLFWLWENIFKSVLKYWNICLCDFLTLRIFYICWKYWEYLFCEILRCFAKYYIWTLSDIGYTELTSCRGTTAMSLRHQWHDTSMAMWLVMAYPSVLIAQEASFCAFDVCFRIRGCTQSLWFVIYDLIWRWRCICRTRYPVCCTH